MSLVYINPLNGDKDVRIHQARNRVNQNLLLKNAHYSRKGSYKNIKSRYLNMLKSNIATKNNMTIKDLEKLEKDFEKATGANIYHEIEAAYARQFNEASALMAGQGDNSILTITQNMYAARGKNERNEFIENLNKLLEIIDGNKAGIKEWKRISKNKNNVQFLTNEAITLTMRAKDLLGKYGKNIDIPEGTVRALATDISEYMAAAIGLASSYTEYEILNFLQNPGKLQGQVKANIKFVGNRATKNNVTGFQDIISKTADSIQQTYVDFSKVPQFQGNGNSSLKISLAYDAVLNTKAYLNTDDKFKYLKLASYGGSNALLTKLLDQLYPNWQQVGSKEAYMIYNALAFSYAQGREDVVSRNYRIIRNDVITIAAEKYLVGLNPDELSGFLVYNYTAYPMLSIFDQIVEEASKKKGQYGSTTTGSNDLFTVRLDVTSAYVNNWSNDPTDKASQISAINRVRKTKQAIHRLKTYGQINKAELKKISSFSKVEGIKIT